MSECGLYAMPALLISTSSAGPAALRKAAAQARTLVKLERSSVSTLTLACAVRLRIAAAAAAPLVFGKSEAM